MKNTTREAFKNMKNKFGHEPFSINEVFGISKDTFLKWYKEVGIKAVVIKTEWSLEKTIDFLNSCAGEDCYEGYWKFITEDGKIFEVEDKFQFVN